MKVIKFFVKIYKKIVRLFLIVNKDVIEEVFPRSQIIAPVDNNPLMTGQHEETKKLLQIEERVEDIYSTLKYSIDIENLPKAKGYLRKLQVLLGYLLSDFHKICEDNNIRYWVNFGTLLGTVRHKGFVPWDDDLDVAMLVEDYQKLLKLDLSEFKSKGIDILSGSPRYFTKIQYSELVPLTLLSLDVFPYYPQKESKELLGKKLEECVREMYTFPDILNNKKKWMEIISKFRLNQNLKAQSVDLIYPGLELISYTKPLFNLKDILPLSYGEFEGHKVRMPRNFHKFLLSSYGDYYDFPSKWLRTLHQREIDLDDLKVRNTIDYLLDLKNGKSRD